MHLLLAGFDLGNVQQIVDEVEHMIARTVDVLQVVAVAVIADGAELFIEHQLGKADDRVERCPHLVADTRQKLRLLRGGALGLGARLGQLLRGAFPLRDVAQDSAEAAAVWQAPHGHEKRDETPLSLTADHFQTVIEDAGNTIVGKAFQMRAHRSLAFDGEECGEGFAGHILIVETEKRFRRPIGRADIAVIVDDHHAIRRRVDNGPHLGQMHLQLGGLGVEFGIAHRFGVRIGCASSCHCGNGFRPGFDGLQRKKQGLSTAPGNGLEMRVHIELAAPGGSDFQSLRVGRGLRNLVAFREKHIETATCLKRFQVRVAGQIEKGPVGVVECVSSMDHDGQRQAGQEAGAILVTVGRHGVERRRNDRRRRRPWGGRILGTIPGRLCPRVILDRFLALRGRRHFFPCLYNAGSIAGCVRCDVRCRIACLG